MARIVVSPTSRRRAYRVSPPRQYTPAPNSSATPGSEMGLAGPATMAYRPSAYPSITAGPYASSSQRNSPNVANPSLSQMCCQVAGVTLSPNHWWASSWATTSSASNPAPIIVMVWVSIAAGNPGTTTWPYSEKGYGPNQEANSSSISGTRAKAAGTGMPAGT